MLEPDTRALLSEQLEPPRGFELVQAVGTTFTLDLATALSVPLSFASKGLVEQEDLGIIAALSQCADRLTVFTQAGEITLGVRSDLVALLEDVVYPVQPARGIFHPKVWLLEYASGDKRAYRLLCNSRNLSESRSWDLSVRLEGAPATEAERAAARKQNQPLVDLLTHLTEISIRDLPQDRAQSLADFAGRIAEVTWEPPPGVTDVTFHFLDGLGGSAPGASSAVDRMLDHAARDVLVISPYLTQGGIERVARMTRQKLWVLSRPEAFDRLPAEVLERIEKTYVLDDLLTEDSGGDALVVDPPAAGAPAIDASVPELVPAAESAPARIASDLAGLHAKAIFAAERSYPSRVHMFIGSANITEGGLGRNVEMMVELYGIGNEFRPTTVWETLEPMLEQYTPSGEPEPDPQQEAERSLQRSLRALAAGTIHARISGAGPYALTAWFDGESRARLEKQARAGITVEWRPATATGTWSPLAVGEETAAALTDLRLTQLTPFLQLRATMRVGSDTFTQQSIVLAELHDDIAGRQDAIIANGIGDGAGFLRLLSLLLQPQQQGFGGFDALGELGGAWNSAEHLSGLFEVLLRAYASDDDGLDVAHRLLEQLRASAGDEFELPEGFEELWREIWQARSARKGKQNR